MKLVKILETPAIIVGISEKLVDDSYVLVSDSKFRLLDFNHIKMVVLKEFTETAVVSTELFDNNKSYVIKALVAPADFADFDPSDYEIGDYVLVYKEGPKLKAEVPVMDKPAPGYSFTPEEMTAAITVYNAKVAAYQAAVKKYNEEVEKFIKETASVPSYGYLVKVIDKSKYVVIADLSYETTKTIPQFDIWGKLPEDMPTKTTVAVGNIKAGTSLKGMTLTDILTAVFGLEFESSVIGVPVVKAASSDSNTSSNTASNTASNIPQQ